MLHQMVTTFFPKLSSLLATDHKLSKYATSEIIFAFQIISDTFSDEIVKIYKGSFLKDIIEKLCFDSILTTSCGPQHLARKLFHKGPVHLIRPPSKTPFKAPFLA